MTMRLPMAAFGMLATIATSGCDETTPVDRKDTGAITFAEGLADPAVSSLGALQIGDFACRGDSTRAEPMFNCIPLHQTTFAQLGLECGGLFFTPLIATTDGKLVGVDAIREGNVPFHANCMGLRGAGNAVINLGLTGEVPRDSFEAIMQERQTSDSHDLRPQMAVHGDSYLIHSVRVAWQDMN